MQRLFLNSACALVVITLAFHAHAAPQEPNPINPTELAKTLNLSGNPAAAAAVLREKASKPDATAADYKELAAALHAMKAFSEEAAALREAHEKFPSDTEILRLRGIALVAAGQPVTAVEIFDMLAAMQPGNAMAYNGKAVAFDTAGNHVAALEIYEKALSLAPDSIPIRNNMALSMVLNDQLDDAITLLETLYKENSQYPKVRHNLALAYGLKGNQQRALELGLEDLTKEQAEENLRFYQRYTSLKSDYKPVELLDEDGNQLDDLFTELEPPAAVAPPPPPEQEIIKAEPPPAIAVPPEASPSAGSPSQMETPDIKADAKDVESPTQQGPSIKLPFGKDAVYEYPSSSRF